MDDDSWKKILLAWAASAVRHGLTVIGGMLVSDGVITSADETKLIGSGMILVGVAWSWWQKVGQKRALALIQGELAHFRDKSAALQSQVTSLKQGEK